MKNALRALACTVAMTASIAAMPATSHAVGVGSEGCTPGYWKNHTENWQETNSSVTFGTLFVSARANVKDLTLAQALDGGGGSGLDGAALILARAATAAWLNAAHDDLGYPLRRASSPSAQGILEMVNKAFRSGDRATMLSLAKQLDEYNNLGCPLN